MITIEQAIRNILDIKNMYTWSTGADEALDMAISALQAQDVPDTNVGDMVSRRGAIEAVSNWLYDGDDRRSVDQLLSALPSVQPEIIRCKGCKHKHLENAVWTCPFGLPGGPDFYCGYGAERRTDDGE